MYADNMELPAFTRCLPASCAAIDWYCFTTGPTAANTQHVVDGRDGQTDTRQLHRPCSAHYVGSAKKQAFYQNTVAITMLQLQTVPRRVVNFFCRVNINLSCSIVQVMQLLPNFIKK